LALKPNYFGAPELYNCLTQSMTLYGHFANGGILRIILIIIIIIISSGGVGISPGGIGVTSGANSVIPIQPGAIANIPLIKL